MRRKANKLVLDTETLRALDVRKVEDERLARVAGGQVQTLGSCRCVTGLNCLQVVEPA